MGIRGRLPFLNGSNPSEQHPEVVASTVEPPAALEAGNGEAANDKPSGVERLGGALDTIGQVMGTEIDSLQQSISEMETRLSRRIDSERRHNSASIDALRNEIFPRFEELRRGQKNELDEVAAETTETATALRESLQQARTEASTRSEEVRIGLEHIVSETEQRLDDHCKTLTKNLTRAQLQLQQLSAMISSVAGVFAEHQAREPQPPPGAKAPTPRSEGRRVPVPPQAGTD